MQQKIVRSIQNGRDYEIDKVNVLLDDGWLVVSSTFVSPYQSNNPGGDNIYAYIEYVLVREDKHYD